MPIIRKDFIYILYHVNYATVFKSCRAVFVDPYQVERFRQQVISIKPSKYLLEHSDEIY